MLSKTYTSYITTYIQRYTHTTPTHGLTYFCRTCLDMISNLILYVYTDLKEYVIPSFQVVFEELSFCLLITHF